MKTPALIALPLFILSACGSDNSSDMPSNSGGENPPLVAEDSNSPVQDDQQVPESEAPAEDSQDNQNPAAPETQDPETPADSEQAPETPADPQDTEQEPDTPVTPEESEPEPSVPDTAGTCEARAAGTTIVSKTTPVRENDNPWYYPFMGPQCVAPDRQYDGPGLAYGDFLLINNAWNGQQSTHDWSQCIALTQAADGSILPSWDFDWGNEDDLQEGLFEWEVKSYPELIYGYKSDDQRSAPCSETGLPVAVSNLPDISIAYNYRTSLTDNRVGDKGDEANNPLPVTGGDRNVAIESFFHSSCEIERGDNSNMELELMVWLEMGNERLPSGQAPVGQYTSNAGNTYDIYTKSDNYVAYLAQNPVTADTLNWTEFVNDTKANAATYGVKTLQDNWCMANIIFGSEIWWGEGSVNLDYYEITSQY